VTYHTLRHTCGSLLFEAGRNVKQVSEWLGHADPSFTLNTYVHLLDEGIGDAEFMDGVFTASPELGQAMEKRSNAVTGAIPSE
jgi:Phage integrase family